MATNKPAANVDVTLRSDPQTPTHTFPCPLCAAGLDIRQSRARKPYCVCNACGIQVFFRGKQAISRLREFTDRVKSIRAAPGTAPTAALAFEQLEQLRAQKHALENKRRILSRDDALEHAIAAVRREIARVETTLSDLAANTKS
jgi:ribosomal protein L29